MTPKRITNYDDAGPKTQKVIDYCARHAIVPRKEDGLSLPHPWRGVSTGEVQAGLRDEFGEDFGNGTPLFAWQRLGADHDLDTALSLLENRREEFLEAGLRELST